MVKNGIDFSILYFTKIIFKLSSYLSNDFSKNKIIILYSTVFSINFFVVFLVLLVDESDNLDSYN